MRRNLKSFLKFILLVITTFVFTFISFHILAPVPSNSNLVKENLIQDNDKIDWHDYKQILSDLQRTGVGEQGKPANPIIDSSLKEKLYSTNGYNGALSDLIALNRSIPDIRHPSCKNKLYLKKLPTASVILPFFNEHLSTLLRTVVSVLNRSPKHLLAEVILVDDGSTKDSLHDELDKYVREKLERVKVIHSPKRQGLITARLVGAKQAIGDVLIFLDSHAEANVNWLPPLLEPIAINYKTCVCPFIDVIDYDTYEYRAQDEGARGSFDWEFFYKRLPLLPEDLKHPADPFKSPVMAGGLFAISAKWFWELGGYDDELAIWGGEQYELSFKIWMCGGEMYDAPCSRIGHIYRKFAAFPNPGIGDFVGRNYKRVADVWMDEYAEYLYKRRPHYRNIDAGDLSQRRAIRDRLNCKSFKWFMDNVAFDLVKKYPPIEPPDFAVGQIKSQYNAQYCVSLNKIDQNEPVALDKCDLNKVDQQKFVLSWRRDLRMHNGRFCFDVSAAGNSPVVLFPCHTVRGNQLWSYIVNKYWFQHGINGRCLEANFDKNTVFAGECSETNKNQRWTITEMNLTALEKQFEL